MRQYKINYVITEENGHRYSIVKTHTLTKRAARRFGQNMEQVTYALYGKKISCEVLDIQAEPRLNRLPAWLANMIYGLVFWIILLSMLWLASAPWTR